MYATAKRAFDVLLAVSLLLPCGIVCAILSLVLFTEIRESPLFLQTRIGYRGKVFTIYKLKTMSSMPNNAEATPVLDDARLGRLGKIVRKVGLDELPEILNILKGEMSFVGPRPLLVSYRYKYTRSEWRRHSVRPGITGLAQVNGKEELPFRSRFGYDLKYVDDLSLFLDLWIILLTIKALLGGIFSRYNSHVDLPEFK